MWKGQESWRRTEGGGWRVEGVGGFERSRRVEGWWEWVGVGGSGEIVALFLGVECVLPKKKLCYNCGRIKRFWDCRMISFCLRMFAGLRVWIVRALCAGCLAAALLSATGEAVAQEADRCGVQGGGLGYALVTLCVAREGDDFGHTPQELCEGFGGTRQTVFAEGEVPDSALPVEAQDVITQAGTTRNTHPHCGDMITPMQKAVRAWALSDSNYHTHLTEHFSNDDFVNCLNASANSLGTAALQLCGCVDFPDCNVIRTGKDRFDCLMAHVPQIEWTSPEWCLGLDRSGTVCLLDSRDFFPCRGLLKHLRRCNLKHNRPALNPFICAASCPQGERAYGAECR